VKKNRQLALNRVGKQAYSTPATAWSTGSRFDDSWNAVECEVVLVKVADVEARANAGEHQRISQGIHLIADPTGSGVQRWRKSFRVRLRPMSKARTTPNRELDPRKHAGPVQRRSTEHQVQA
jgi:hypothetical protein